jgi:hypothetical protein
MPRSAKPEIARALSSRNVISELLRHRCIQMSEPVLCEGIQRISVMETDIIQRAVISPKRLAAVRWTAFCIRCQEIADRGQGDSADILDELLANAA